jgi:hypothetical protein
MASRYEDTVIFKDELEIYRNLMEDRGVPFIRHYATPQLRYPSVSQLVNLTRLEHIWKTGDRYYKIASKYYGRPELWWVIAHFNQKPTEAQVGIGEIIYIPLPLEKILLYYKG